MSLLGGLTVEKTLFYLPVGVTAGQVLCHRDPSGCCDAAAATCDGAPLGGSCTCVEQSDMQMPPAGGLSAEEKAQLHAWIACGAPLPRRLPISCRRRRSSAKASSRAAMSLSTAPAPIPAG